MGENKAKDLLRKQEEFGDTFEWHFIGHLQRRKVKEIVTRVALIHSVDSVRLVEELPSERRKRGWTYSYRSTLAGKSRSTGSRRVRSSRCWRRRRGVRGGYTFVGSRRSRPWLNGPKMCVMFSQSCERSVIG